MGQNEVRVLVGEGRVEEKALVGWDEVEVGMGEKGRDWGGGDWEEGGPEVGIQEAMAGEAKEEEVWEAGWGEVD